MNNRNSTHTGTQQGIEGLYLLEGGAPRGRRASDSAAGFLNRVFMDHAATSRSDIVPATKRRVSIRFMRSSPVYVHITMRDSAQEATDPCPVPFAFPSRFPQRQKPAKIGFYLEAPSARRVKLAADFTQWEKFPIELTRLSGGLWGIIVPLPPGQYSYRFIVDGHWCDDVRSLKSVADTFGACVL